MQLKLALTEVQKHLVKILSCASRRAFILSWHRHRGQNMVSVSLLFLFSFFLPNKYSWHLHLVCHGKKMWGGLFLSYFLTWFNKNQRIKKFLFPVFYFWGDLSCFSRFTGETSRNTCRMYRVLYAQNSAGFPEVWSPSTRGWLNHIKERDVPVFSALNWIFLSTFCLHIDEVFWIGHLSSVVRSQSGEQTFCRFPARCLTAGPWAQPQELLCKVDVRKYLTNSARPTAGERRAAGEESRRGGLSPTSSGSR